MKKLSFASLMKKDWRIVEHSIWYYLFSGLVILLGIILACTVHPKIGMEFQSGISIQVEYDIVFLTEENESAEKTKIRTALESLTYEEKNESGEAVQKSYGISVRKFETSKSLDGAKRLIEASFKSPFLENLSETEAARYNELKKEIETKLREQLNAERPDTAKVKPGATLSPAFSTELIITAACAVLLASVIMLLYVMFRFELASGLAAVIALLHDLLFMFSFMVFFQVEITSTFIAAVVAILGYSINNTLVIFDRVREDMRNKKASEKKSSVAATVNSSLKSTFNRCLNTSVTTLFAMIVLAIFGVASIRVFAFPIIIGILAGTYSSFAIAPSIYVQFKSIGNKVNKSRAKKRLSAQKTSRPIDN